MLLNFYFWQLVYYLLDPEDQLFGVKSTEKRARWAGVDENIGAKMCYKLVDDKSGKIIYQSVIWSVTEPSTANLRVNPIEPLSPDTIHSTEPDAMLDKMMTAADFDTPFSDVNKKDPVDSILASTKSKTWQEMERSKQVEHQEDVQQRYFNSYQPNFPEQQHRYPTRSKTSANEAMTTPEGKAFVFLRDKGEKSTPVFKQFEFILRDELGKSRLDPQGKEIVVIGPSPNDIMERVFLTKPDERGNMERVWVVELINEFNDKLNRDPMQCKFKIAFEKNTPSSKGTHLDDIMSNNDILDYVERENNNEDGDYWRFRKIISYSLIPGKKEKNKTGIEIQVVWETSATSTESFEALKKNIPVDLTIYAKENNLLELDRWDTLK